MAQQTNWSTIQDLVDNGQTVSNAFDIAFQAVDDNATELDGLAVDSVVLDSRVGVVEGLLKYFYNKVFGVSTTQITPQPLNNLTVVQADAPVGTYEIKLSLSYSYASTTKSAFFNFSINGGTPFEFRREPKDNTDAVSLYYGFPYEHDGLSDITVVAQFWSESSGVALIANFCDIVIERKA